MNRTLILPALLLAVLAVEGCTSRVLLTEADRRPGRIHKNCRVYLSGGEQLQFERASFNADSLVGELKVQVERSDGEEFYYQDVVRKHPVALSQIDSVAVIRTDIGKSVLLGAGAAAAVIFLRSIADTDESGSGGSNGRGDPPPPQAVAR